MTDGILTGLRLRDLGIVASTWLRFAMRSGGGVISLFIVVVIGLFITSMVLAQAEQLASFGRPINAEKKLTEEEKARRIDGSTDDVLSFVLPDENKKEEVDFLTKERPAVFSGVLLILMYLIPFAACSAAFNQTASDIGTRGLRFLLSRTERPNIFLGRFFSATVFLGMALAFLVGVIALYIRLRFDFYESGAVALAAMEGWWVLFMFSLPFVALCSWISSTQRSPFASLALCYALSVLPWLLLKIAVNTLSAVDVDWEWLRLLTPWDWRQGLNSYSTAIRLKCHGAMVGFTAVFLLFGLINFRKRDL